MPARVWYALLTRGLLCRSGSRRSALHRALEQGRDDLALEDEEHDERRRQDEDRSGAQQRDVGSPLALEGAERAGDVRCFGSSTRISARMNWFHVQTDMQDRRATTIAGLASGTWTRQKRSHIPAPSTRAASDSSRGMFTKCARIQKTANGMYRPMSGTMIASLVFRIPSERTM